jgi:hypothetical protein
MTRQKTFVSMPAMDGFFKQKQVLVTCRKKAEFGCDQVKCDQADTARVAWHVFMQHFSSHASMWGGPLEERT